MNISFSKEQIEEVLATRIPGGSAASWWFWNYDSQDERTLENIRDVVGLMIETALSIANSQPKEIQRDPAVAAIEFALNTDSGLEFLKCWFQGDFDVIRREWPKAPRDVFTGADVSMNANNTY